MTRRRSRNWPSGSTRRWRRIRLAVLERDTWTCGICHKPIDPALKPPHPGSASVHHLVDRQHAGDDPRALVSAHRACNQEAGSPSQQDPRPRLGLTQW